MQMELKRFAVTDALFKVLILSGLLAFCLPADLSAKQRSQERPYAYLYPEKHDKLTEHLQQEDIDVHELREDIELDVETYRPGIRARKSNESRQETRLFRAGTILVKTKQKSGDKVVNLLDPNSEDRTEIRKLLGRLRRGKDYPVVVLRQYVPIRHGTVRPLEEEREFDKPITFETIYDPKKRVNFSGSAVFGLTWLDDGEHYLQVRDGKLYRVHAATGRSGLFFEQEKLADGLKGLPIINDKTAESLGPDGRDCSSSRKNLRMD